MPDLAQTVDQPIPSTPAPDAQFEVSLTDWCRDHSKVSKSVELLGAFYRTETAAGRVLALKGTFDMRFDVFANDPA